MSLWSGFLLHFNGFVEKGRLSPFFPLYFSRPSVERQTADSWPTNGRQLTYSRPTNGKQLTDRRPTAGRQSTYRRPTVGRQFFFSGAVHSQLPVDVMMIWAKRLDKTNFSEIFFSRVSTFWKFEKPRKTCGKTRFRISTCTSPRLPLPFL